MSPLCVHFIFQTMSQTSGGHIDIKKLSFLGVIVSLGIVFGDIGTSPLYVMKAIINAGKSGGFISEEYIEGALSCIIWTITLQTTLKYVIIALRADNKGEGGILSLYSLVFLALQAPSIFANLLVERHPHYGKKTCTGEL